MSNCDPINECIACGGTDLVEVLNLNSQPLANSYKTKMNSPEELFPLAINRCKSCNHVQLTHKVNPGLLFKNYLYVSGTTKTQLEYFDWFSRFAVETFSGTPRTVLDIGCNDGSQLDYFKKLNFETHGVDPAENLYELSSQRHKIVCDYFNDKTYSYGTLFDIIVCQNAFAHNYNQLELLKNISNVMGAYSLLFISTSQADMILNGEFDTIYHEHLSFYCINSMNELCKRAGLNLINVIKHPIHGKSFIFVISKFKSASNHIQNLINCERESGLYDDITYVEYAKKCNNVVLKYREYMMQMKHKNIPIIGYGAPAKGNTFLNYAKVYPDYIIDDNPMKQGKFTPGSSVAIYGPELLDKINSDSLCFVPLAWNFYKEIKERIKARRNGKDYFLCYFPEVFLEDSNNTVLYHPV